MHVELTDGVVLLRPVRAGDAQVYFEQQDLEMVARFEWAGPAQLPRLRETFAAWEASWRNGGDERNFVIELAGTGEVIGDCEVELRPDGLVNVMYVVFAPWRGMGYATRTVQLLVDYAAEAFPNKPLVFRVHPDNAGSVALARAVGAALEGTEASKSGRLLERWVRRPPA